MLVHIWYGVLYVTRKRFISKLLPYWHLWADIDGLSLSSPVDASVAVAPALTFNVDIDKTLLQAHF